MARKKIENQVEEIQVEEIQVETKVEEKKKSTSRKKTEKSPATEKKTEKTEKTEKPLVSLTKALEGAYVREREEYLIASEKAFSIIEWNVKATDGLKLIPDKDNEKIWTVTNGTENIVISVKKQVHQKTNTTWQIDKKKFSDGSLCKINGRNNGTFEVFWNVRLVDGKHKMERLAKPFKKQDEAMKFYEKKCKEHEDNLKKAEKAEKSVS